MCLVKRGKKLGGGGRGSLDTRYGVVGLGFQGAEMLHGGFLEG